MMSSRGTLAEAGQDIYSTDTSRSETLVVVTSVGQAIIALAIGLRLYTRLVITRKFGLDDWLMMAAVFVNVAITADIIICAHAGAGKHIGTLSTTLELFSKTSWIGSIMNGVSMTLMKASILVFYLKLFPGRFVRWGSYALLFINIGYGIASTFVLIFQCTPIGADDFTPGVNLKCLNMRVFYFVNAWMSLILDITTFTLPLPSIMRLKMSLSQRISVALIFAVGVIPCTATIIRITYYYASGSRADVTYTLADSILWSVVELDLGIICACAAAFKPLIRAFFPTWLGGSSAGTSDHGNVTLSRTRKQSYALQSFGTTNRDNRDKFGVTSKGMGGDTELGAITHSGYEGGVFNVEIAKSTEVVMVDDGKFPVQNDSASLWKHEGQKR